MAKKNNKAPVSSEFDEEDDTATDSANDLESNPIVDQTAFDGVEALTNEIEQARIAAERSVRVRHAEKAAGRHVDADCVGVMIRCTHADIARAQEAVYERLFDYDREASVVRMPSCGLSTMFRDVKYFPRSNMRCACLRRNHWFVRWDLIEKYAPGESLSITVAEEESEKKMRAILEPEKK